MALFDKINLDKIGELAKNVSDKTVELAKTVSDKTGDMLEIGKVSAQISSANSSIEELKTRLGDHYWNLFKEGQTLDEDAVVLCNTIKDYCEEVENLKAQLAALKAGPAAKANVCPACGAENAEDAAFCTKCGAKLEQEEEPAVAEDDATEVELSVESEEEAPAAKTCPTCGAENEPDSTFCQRCGSKL